MLIKCRQVCHDLLGLRKNRAVYALQNKRGGWRCGQISIIDQAVAERGYPGNGIGELAGDSK
jgi:hypothetical protein